MKTPKFKLDDKVYYDFGAPNHPKYLYVNQILLNPDRAFYEYFLSSYTRKELTEAHQGSQGYCTYLVTERALVQQNHGIRRALSRLFHCKK